MQAFFSIFFAEKILIDPNEVLDTAMRFQHLLMLYAIADSIANNDERMQNLAKNIPGFKICDSV